MKNFRTFTEIKEEQELEDLYEDLKEIQEDREFAGDIAELLEMEELLERAPLTVTQRRRRAIIFRRLQPRIQMAKRRQMRRMAGTEKLLTRAKRQAKNRWRSRLAGGKPYQDLSISQKVFIDKRLEKKSAFLTKLAKRMLPKVRMAERQRFANMQHKVQTPGQVHSESINDEPKKKHEIEEDAPANAVGGGAVAGLGVGPQGEPGGGKALLFKKKDK